jgi:TolB protein
VARPAALQAHRTNFVITPVDKGTINGIIYLHATWTGYQPEYHGKMQGGFYVAEDRDLVIELVYQDVLPGASQTVALLDSSLRTFRKVSQKVYYSSQWLEHAQVWSMNPDGSEKVCLTTRSDTDYHPAVSPDGKTVAFTTHRSGVRSIWLMNPDGSNQHALTDKLDAGLCSWSPDGERLTFSSNRDGKYCIYTMRKDGSEVKKITDGPSDDCPSWGANDYIVYEGMLDGIWRILQVEANGKGLKPLTDDKAHARWPNISSDGGYILYTGYADKTGKSSHIYLMKSDGSMKTQLTKGEQSDREPCWTADGAQILFHSNRSGKYEVYSMESETLKPHQIAAETLDTREVTTAGRAYINP